MKYIGVHMRRSERTHSESLRELHKVFGNLLSDVQIFVHGPASIKPITIDPDFVKTAHELDIDINVHGSYLCVPWRSKFLWKHTLDNFRNAHKIQGKNVVLHIPFLPVKEWMPSIISLVKRMEE